MTDKQKKDPKEEMSRSSRNEGRWVLVFCFLASLTISACTSRERTVLNATVISINGHQLNTKEFAERLAVRLRGYDALFAKDESNLARAKEAVIQAYILEQISREYAKANGIKVESSEIDAEVAKVRSKYPDDYAFRRALTDENVTLEKYRSDFEYTILQKKIAERLTAELPEPKESEFKAYYDSHKAEFNRPARVRLRQIVLEKEDDAKRIQDELAAGKSLTELAKQYSIAPEGSNDGDTGWLEKGTLEVFDNAFKMNRGQRSKLLKSPYGFHIFEVLQKEPEAHLSFPVAKARIRARLMEEKSQHAFSAWLEEQVRHSTVKRNDEVIKSIKVSTGQ